MEFPGQSTPFICLVAVPFAVDMGKAVRTVMSPPSRNAGPAWGPARCGNRDVLL